MLRCLKDGEDHTLQVFQNVFVGKAQHAIAAGGEPLVAPFVMAKTIREIMTFAVDLDHDLAGMSDEIRNVVAHRSLSAKAETGQAMCLEMTP
ncbi:hypothetical protein AYJ54_07015 [Bradyrhizobium centrolobii]|uniref:Uncharacterized protein n=1 Tax=Bradyrhizobium centrolobii TaxID=1505087 RepID=A0A176YWZ6_9BRAD|nr:hypothetical protein AYJ54_07015 [Bradyrhizobium centrolobii]